MARKPLAGATSASEREDAIVTAYLAGDDTKELMAHYRISGRVLYDILKRSGKVPLRSHRRTANGDRADAMLAGLHDLVEYQAQQLVALRKELDAERRAARARARKRAV